jgi:hypothetical protein
MIDHLTQLLELTTVVPAVNQIEVHPYFQQREVQAFNAAHGIATQAWSPIGGITFYMDGEHTSTPRGRDDRGHRRGAREEAGAGHAPLAPAHGRSAISEVGQPEAHHRELLDRRLRAHRRRADGHRRPRHRQARWPEATALDLETMGFPIPEA